MDGDEGGFRVVMEGFLAKSPEKLSPFHKWQTRYFFLRKGKRLEYWSSATDGEMKGNINLKKCFGVSDSEDKFSKKGFAFSVHLPQRKYILVAGSQEERANWVTALKLVCDLKNKKLRSVEEAKQRERTDTITSDQFKSDTDSVTGSFFEESDEEADGDHLSEHRFPTATSLKKPSFSKMDSFAETPDLEAGCEVTREMEGNMFQNPLLKMRKAKLAENSASAGGIPTFEGTYTNKKSSANVVIKIDKPNVYITYKDSGEDLFVWKLSEIDTYTQNKSIFTVRSADGVEHVFVIADGDVATALARAESLSSMRHASLSVK